MPERVVARLRNARRCVLEDRAHGVVELADAGEAGGECDVAEWQVRRLDQHPGGLCPLRAGQRERAGADLGLQQPLQLPGGVAEVGGQAADTFAVHRAVGDQPHGPRHDVAAHIPFRRTRGRVGAAPLACAEARALRGRRRRVEPHVTGERWPHRATGPAVDPGGQHRGDEPAVEPGVLGLDRPVAAFEIFVHGSTITPAHRQHWRKSDIVVDYAVVAAPIPARNRSFTGRSAYAS